MAFDPNAPVTNASGIFGMDVSEAAAKVILVPVPWEPTTSYGGGTANGPRAILDASHQLDFFDPDVGTPYEAGIHMLPASSRAMALGRAAKVWARVVIEPDEATAEQVIEARDSVNRASEELNNLVRVAVTQQLKKQKIVGLVGGDHSVSFGSVAAHADHFGKFGILQIDAHADLRRAYHGFHFSHASVMHAVLEHLPSVEKLVQVGIRDLCPEEAEFIRTSDRVRTFFDRELARARLSGRMLEALDAAAEALPDQVYVSFDIDGLDPKLCPHTGTPVPGGLELSEVSFLLERVVERKKRIIGFDLTEVVPGPEGDEWDANVGARALYKLIGYTLKSRLT